MDMNERNERIRQSRMAAYSSPFDPGTTPERQLPNEARVANALEYIAAQLGTIARSVERMESLMEAQALREAQRDVRR